MITIRQHFCAAALGLVAIASPFSARAGESVASGTVSMMINPGRCEISGQSIDLGVFQQNQTWRDVGERIGYINESNLWVTGAMGDRYATFGSILCDAGMPYSLTITGSSSSPDQVAWLPLKGAVRFSLQNGRAVYLIPAVRTLDGQEVVHNYDWNGMGQTMIEDRPLAGVGAGHPQAVVGHLILGTDLSALPDHSYLPSNGGASLDERIGQSGMLSDTLTYTLTF